MFQFLIAFLLFSLSPFPIPPPPSPPPPPLLPLPPPHRRRLHQNKHYAKAGKEFTLDPIADQSLQEETIGTTGKNVCET